MMSRIPDATADLRTTMRRLGAAAPEVIRAAHTAAEVPSTIRAVRIATEGAADPQPPTQPNPRTGPTTGPFGSGANGPRFN